VGDGYQPTAYCWAAWAYTSALAAMLIVGMEAWRENKQIVKN